MLATVEKHSRCLLWFTTESNHTAALILLREMPLKTIMIFFKEEVKYQVSQMLTLED